MTSELMPHIEGFPRPNWEQITREIETAPESEWPNLWTDWAQRWMAETILVLPVGYQLFESENFLVLSSQERRFSTLLLEFLERTRRRILSSLEGIASDSGHGPHVLLMFHDQESYYRYISYFFPEEGEFGLSSGIFLNESYGHFVFPFVEMFEAEATAAHELTHALLRHLPIPTWLNEGLAVTMEDEICDSWPLTMSDERFAEHRDYWNAESIQAFWSGEAFYKGDEGMQLSYELARFCVRSLAHEYDVFAAFANSAESSNAGEQAANEHFNGSLGGLIAQFFGDGDWSPDPSRWFPSQA
ncbi:MAG: hypothetical protein AAF578_04635 [Pseudomonadota bacterium]